MGGYTATIVAVSSQRGVVHLKIHDEAVDTDKFCKYLKILARKMYDKAFCLYMDQLAVHRTIAVRDLREELEITTIFNPSYSPELNPIESCFSHVKRKFKSQRLWALINGQEFDMDEEIDDAFEVITPGMVARCAKRSYKLLKDLKK